MNEFDQERGEGLDARFSRRERHIAAVLAEAAARAAYEMVRVNTALLDDAATRHEMEQQALDILTKAQSLLTAIQSDLNERL